MSSPSGTQLAQSRPSGTTAVSAFTAKMHTEVTRIVVCNVTASAAAYSICHDDDGSTFEETTALFWGVSLPANSTDVIDMQGDDGGFSIKKNGQIEVKTSVANAINFTLYGRTANQAPQ